MDKYKIDKLIYKFKKKKKKKIAFLQNENSFIIQMFNLFYVFCVSLLTILFTLS